MCPTMKGTKAEDGSSEQTGRQKTDSIRGCSSIAAAGTCCPKPVAPALRQICETNPNDGRDQNPKTLFSNGK